MHFTGQSRREFFSDWLMLGLELHSCVQLHDNHIVGGADHVVQYERMEGHDGLLLHPPLT